MATEGPDRMTASAEETVERVRQLNEQILELSARAGQMYLDVYERTLRNMADLYERAAATTPFGEWAAAMARAQADFARDLAETYAAAGHDMMAATRQAAPTGAAGGGDEPWPGYDAQPVDEVVNGLEGADDELRSRVREYERRNKNRARVIEATQQG